jgi:hypothetical protein
MILALSVIEEQFLSSNPTLGLPPTWQVIYQEGIRGNHILFSKDDVSSFRENSDLVDFSDESEISEVVADAAYEVMTAASFPAMTEIIDQCDAEVRRGLFRIYQRCVLLWSQHLKISLH